MGGADFALPGRLCESAGGAVASPGEPQGRIQRGRNRGDCHDVPAALGPGGRADWEHDRAAGKQGVHHDAFRAWRDECGRVLVLAGRQAVCVPGIGQGIGMPVAV